MSATQLTLLAASREADFPIALADREIAGDAWANVEFDEPRKQYDWWQANKEFAATDAEPVAEATLHGSRMALRYTAFVPLTMAALYLLLLVAFKAPETPHSATAEELEAEAPA